MVLPYYYLFPLESSSNEEPESRVIQGPVLSGLVTGNCLAQVRE